MPIRRRPLALVCLTVLALAGGVVAAAGAGASTHPRRVRVTRVFGRRYCELFLVHHSPAGLTADVYNTFGLNACPATRWRAIDLATVAKRNHAVLAVRNGPRYWLMNEIDKQFTAAEVIRDLGGLRMIEEATVAVGSSTAPYTVHRVDRATVWVYSAGATVYELRAPTGSVWVMQSYSQQIDPALRLADLRTLGHRLTLPAGWSYRTRRLTRPLRVVTVSTSAQVLQDNLDNTYSRVS